MNLSLSQSDDVPAEWIDQATREVLSEIAGQLDPHDATVGLVLVDDARIQEINREFRDKDHPTDVISFSYLEDDSPGGDDLVGEIYISHQTLEKEATELGVDTGKMFVRIAVHGLLHVLGYDHEVDEETERMEAREREILERYLTPQDVAALL